MTFTYELNNDRPKKIEIQIEADSIDDADAICNMIISHEIDKYDIKEK